jgi:hypothetical protein
LGNGAREYCVAAGRSRISLVLATRLPTQQARQPAKVSRGALRRSGRALRAEWRTSSGQPFGSVFARRLGGVPSEGGVDGGVLEDVFTGVKFAEMLSTSCSICFGVSFSIAL